MRLLATLCLAVASTAPAAPQKDALPTGAVARLGSPASEKAVEVNALAFLNDKNLFVGTSAGWTTWDLEKRQRRQEKPVGGPAFAVIRDRDRLLIGSTRKLHVIEPVQSPAAEPARSWDSSDEAVSVLCVAPGGRRVVFADGEQKLTVLDTSTGKSTGTIELASRAVSASMTSNGRIFAVVTRDGAARVYGLAATGRLEPHWTKRVARSERGAAGFSPDGRVFAVASAGRVMILDSVNGLPMQRLERRFGEGDVRCVAFSPDGKQVAIGSSGPDPVVRVSDLVTGNEQATFTGHVGDVNAVAFSADGRTLATGGTDGTVFLWKVPVPIPVSRPMTTAEAWESLDALEANVAYQNMGSLLAQPGRAVTVIGEGIRGMADEQARIRRWIGELDHDEFRTREAARRSLLKTGLRGAGALTDPGRKKMGPEGEQRVRLILESLESQGLHIPESGLFGEPLRSVRGVRILETIGGKHAREILDDAAKGPADLRLTKEAKAALEVLPDEQ